MRIEEIRSGLVARLRARRQEIEEATLTRVYGVSEPIESEDPEYAHGLRIAVSAALDYGLAALERSEERAPPIPAVLLAQSRLAARAGVNLDTVLRRYLAGYTLMGDFVIQEAEKGGLLKGGSLQRLLRAQAALFDRLLAAVGEEYAREGCGRLGSPEQRRIERVKRLLAGELVDTSELGYELGGWHLGIVAVGPGAASALSELARACDRRLLSISREEGAVWAWLGSQRAFAGEQLESLLSSDWPGAVAVALGEPGEGISGWRATHRQAKAALPIALRGPEKAARYRDVALLASTLRDELLVSSLRDLYIDPLSQARDGGAVLRETLHTYFSTGRNSSSAASLLGVTRRTVTSRLRAIEEYLGRPLDVNTAEIEIALQLQELDSSQ
jgi:PucR C-terminal helix-turn-helix domain/GGDEF-like domain